MQALILATDEASKLHPLTEQVPAPLLPVLNRPVMAYTLELLVRAGLRDIGVAVYNKAGSIEAHFASGSRTAAQLTYLLQRESRGTAGSVRWAAAGNKETLVVLPGDALLEVDICAALAFHQSRGAIATAIVHEPQPGCPLNPIVVAPDGRITGFSAATAQPGARVFADTGAYIFEPQILDWLPPRQALDCYDELLPGLLGVEPLQAFVAEGYWNPIHSIPAYHQAQRDALSKAVSARGADNVPGTTSGSEGEKPGPRYLSIQDRELAPGVLVGRHVTVHPSARLIPPVYIGSGSQIERDAEVGPEVVIGANTVVDAGATVRNSSVLEGTYVGRLVKVDGRVVRGGLVVDAKSGDSLPVVDAFLLGEISPRLIVGVLSRVGDIMSALILLLLLLPALAVLTVPLLLTSLLAGQGGRVFELRSHVRWRRTGDGGAPEKQTYGVPHFRTRRANGAFLPLGSFLERTQLDALPVVFSVLKGDIRLVGVKPLDHSEAGQLVEEWQRLPYEGPAGLTGLWYVRANGADLDEIVATDAYYTATRGFLQDLYLLLATPAAWIRHWAPVRSGSSRPPRPRVEKQVLTAGWRRRSSPSSKV